MGGLLVATLARADAPRMTSLEIRSAEGYATIAWSWEQEAEGDQFQLVIDEPDGERVAYEGPNHQVFLSGLPEGDYALRVRHRLGVDGEWGEWSQSASLVVRHHSLGVALTLFTLGGLMVAWIVIFLVRSVAATGRSTA